MTQTYRTDDGARWGSGKGSDLDPAEVDINFWDLIQRMIAQEARPDPSAGIDHFSVSGTDFYVHMTDATVLGPYDLPFATFNSRGEWAVDTSYSILDTFTINGGLYVVIFDHTSDATSFDPGANDGAGHDYYTLMIQTPGSALPTGGAVSMVLEKSTTSDYAVTWGWKLPIDGTSRQYLIKQSGTNQDADWDTPQAEDIEFTPVTGSAITADNVADAIEQASSGIVIAANVTYTPPTGSSLTSTNVQDVIDEIEAQSLVSESNNSATPTGNVSTTEKAMGLGFTITPDRTGTLLIWIGGVALNSTLAGDGTTITGRYGTGTPPANGDTSGLGTQFSIPQHIVASTTAGQQGFIVMDKLTGLTVGDTYWFDLSLVAVTGGGASVKDVQYVALEV